MEFLTTLANLIPSLGFPVVCVLALGGFVFWLFKHYEKQRQENMQQLLAENRKNMEQL